MKFSKVCILSVIANAMVNREPLVAQPVPVHRGYSDVKPNTKRKMFKINQRMQRKAKSCKVHG